MNLEKLDKTTVELYKIFKKANEELFKSELVEPMITIQGGKKAMGWCTTSSDTWIDTDSGEQKYEININPEYFNQGLDEAINTIVHECVHLYNLINDIKDCNGKVHNKKFKEKAEEIGFIVEKNKSTGWGVCTFSDDLKDKIVTWEIDETAFNWVRKPKPKPDKEEEDKFLYVCPNKDCDYGTKFTIKHELKEAVCKCGESLEMELKKPKSADSDTDED